MPARPPFVFARVLSLVLALDLATKYLAERFLQGSDIALFGPVGLTLLYNDEVPFGSMEQQLNTLMILLVIGLGLRALGALSALDRTAPVMLGLITGAGLANAVGLVTSPAGVVDFLAVGWGDDRTVLNLADLATLLGVLLCGRVAFRLALALRRRPALAEPAARAGVRAGRASARVPEWVLDQLDQEAPRAEPETPPRR